MFSGSFRMYLTTYQLYMLTVYYLLFYITCNGVNATLDAVPETCFLTVVLPPQVEFCLESFCCKEYISKFKKKFTLFL